MVNLSDGDVEMNRMARNHPEPPDDQDKTDDCPQLSLSVSSRIVSVCLYAGDLIFPVRQGGACIRNDRLYAPYRTT